MCEPDFNNNTINKAFCDNMTELEKELDKPSKKEKCLSIMQFILIMVTIFTILMFYKYPQVNFGIKWASTIVLCTLCNIVSHRLGLESGLEMVRKTAKAKENFNEQMVERMVKMIRERKAD